MCAKIDDKMKQNILNYGKEIKKLSSFAEAVRKLPGMYIGDTGNHGVINMNREVYQNNIDELIKPSSPCKNIIFSYDENTNISIYEDDGRGIPFDLIADIFTSEHTSSNYKKKLFEYSAGRHGVGAKVTNALSDFFIVESYRLGKVMRAEFHKGILSEKGVYPIENTRNKEVGTIISFHADHEIMGDYDVSGEELEGLILSILTLTPIGSSVQFNCIKKDGTEIHKLLKNEDGLLSHLILRTSTPIIKPIIIQQDTGEMKADIELVFDSNNLSGEPDITNYSNFCPMTGGTHVKGFVDGLTKYFVTYMNKIYLASAGNSKKKNKLSVISSDVLSGLVAIIHTCVLYPTFGGQAKDTITNPELYDFVKDLMINSLEEWAKNNPSDFQKVCHYIKDIAEIRVKSTSEKVNISSRYTTNSLSKGLPSKYKRPTGTKNLELVIVEGDSAAGSAKNSRDRVHQGIYPIRGKMPNPIDTLPSKYLANEEVRGIIAILGGQIVGNKVKLDLEKCPYEKVIIMPDADIDGAHIRTLTSKLFIMYMPQLVADGRLYYSVAPLYGLIDKAATRRNKKGKVIIKKYFTDRLDMTDYMVKQFCKTNEILDNKKQLIPEKEMINIIYNNVRFDYTYKFNSIKSRYALDPFLLEDVLNVISINGVNDKLLTALKKSIEKKYRFIKVKNSNDVIIIEGLEKSLVQTIIINNRFLQEVNGLLNIIKQQKELNFVLNGTKCGIYQLMTLYENSMDELGICRYKGLGEMDADQLAQSTLLETGDRVLIQYDMDDMKLLQNKIREVESNRNSLLEGRTGSRNDIIG